MAAPPDIQGYRVLQFLGAGGFAEVWKAEHVSLGLVQAVKVLHGPALFETLARQSGAPTPSYDRIVQRFSEEARTLALFQHDHIVRFFDIRETSDGRPCLSLEYCPESLAGRLGAIDTVAQGSAARLRTEQRQLAWKDAVEVARQLLQALQYIHNADRIHRDIKPANVLRGSDGRWKLSDFGLVKDISPSAVQRSSRVAGTAEYMAPEARRGRAEPRSDLWSVGALLYRCLTGEDYVGGLDGIEEEWPDVPGSLWLSLGRVLDRRVDRRFGDAAAMLEAVGEVTRGKGRGVRRQPNPIQPSKPPAVSGEAPALIGGHLPPPPGAATPMALAEAWLEQGQRYALGGDWSNANAAFTQALDHVPDHPVALRRLVECAKQLEEWRLAVDYQMRLADVCRDPKERIVLLLEVGDTYRNSLGNDKVALRAYRAAADACDSDSEMLSRLFDVFVALQDWECVVAVTVKLAKLDQELETRSRRLVEAARLLQFNLEDEEGALEHFGQALDVHLSLDTLGAFRAIESILTKRKDWVRLAQEYLRMIERVSVYSGAEDLDGPMRMLCRNLGEVYRTRLHDYDKAIQAYRTASALDPDNTSVHAILAQLYELAGGSHQEAIDEYHKLVWADPLHFDTYHILFTRFLEQQDFDGAWCMAGVLVLFSEASERQHTYYQRYRGPSPPVANRRLNRGEWEALHHPGLSPGLAKIMALYATAFRGSFSEDPHKAWKVHKKKDLLDLNQPTEFAGWFNYASNLLGVGSIRVYLGRERGLGLRNANCDPQAMVAGYDLVVSGAQRELAFKVGKALCMMQPTLYLCSAFPSVDSLWPFILAAMHVAKGGGATYTGSPAFDRWVRELERNPSAKHDLVSCTRETIANRDKPDLDIWLKAQDYTGDRVGLLLGGDVVQAAESIKAGAWSLSKATTKERLRELVRFSVSRRYLKLRKDIGLAVGASKGAV